MTDRLERSDGTSRRAVLRTLAGSAAGLLLPAPLFGGQRSVVEPRSVDLELIAAWQPVAVAGQAAQLATYNGQFPGPLLRLREGDHVRLRLINRLRESTNLHLHGLHIPPSVDDPFLMVPPGESVMYEFTLPPGSAGTYWYHPHMHGKVATQLFAGLAGPLIVDGPLDWFTRLRRIADRVVVLKDLSLSGGVPSTHSMFDWMNGKEGDLLLVNGLVAPTLRARRGMLRLRLVNASNARYYNLALEQHHLHLIGTDAGFVGAPVELDSLLLAPGERADVLVRLRDPGSFRLLNLPYNRGGMMMGHGRPTALSLPQAMLTIEADEAGTMALPGRLASVESVVAGVDAPHRRFVLGAAMMGARFYINGRSFDEGRVDVQARRGAVEVWDVENPTAMDHPFHLHVYPFQIAARGGRPEALVAWKDVVNVPARGSVRLTVPLRNFSGRTVYHCHIVEHEDRGMMGQLAVV